MRHAAISMQRHSCARAPFEPLAYGENIVIARPERWSIHAEVNAIRKLPPMPRKRRLKRVDLIVIRTTPNGVLGNSQPCAHCATSLVRDLASKGYILDRVIFSNADGGLTVLTLGQLRVCPVRPSGYYRKKWE